jgi:ABC-type molybdate transport system permease subunit
MRQRIQHIFRVFDCSERITGYSATVRITIWKKRGNRYKVAAYFLDSTVGIFPPKCEGRMIASINPELYEAAKIDGANRFKQILYITLPHLKPTIVILLILALGGILNAGFDQHFLLGNELTREYSDVLSTYSFRYGIQNGMFSYGAAVGMFSSVVAFIIVLIVNYTAKKTNGQSLF